MEGGKEEARGGWERGGNKGGGGGRGRGGGRERAREEAMMLCRERGSV